MTVALQIKAGPCKNSADAASAALVNINRFRYLALLGVISCRVEESLHESPARGACKAYTVVHWTHITQIASQQLDSLNHSALQLDCES